METLEQLKEIINSAPEGATHYVVDQYDFTEGYFKLENCIAYCDYGVDGWKYVEGAVIELNGTHEFRSLSDIKLIIELMELNQNMHTTVAGYLWGKDWAHWNEFNAGKFKL